MYIQDCLNAAMHSSCFTVQCASFVHVLTGGEKALTWAAAESGQTEDGKWTCRNSSQAFVSQTTLHPCALPDQQCCQADAAAVGVRYASSLWDKSALAEVTFEVWPTCGDGLSLQWILTQDGKQQQLFAKAFAASANSPPHRETVERTIPLFPGDSLLFVVQPGANHDCDGVYVHDIKVWQSKASNGASVLQPH